MMLNAFVQNVADAETHVIGEQQLGDLLRRARFFHGQPRSHQQSQQRPDDHYHQRHHHMFGNRHLRVVRLDVQRGKQRESDATKIVVHKMSDPVYAFFHRFPGRPGLYRIRPALLGRTPDFVHTRHDGRGSQSAQAYYHAQKGNFQNLKNSIHSQCEQPVAESRGEVRGQRNPRPGCA